MHTDVFGNTSHDGTQHTSEDTARCRLRHTRSVTYHSLKYSSSKKSKYGRAQEWYSIYLLAHLVLKCYTTLKSKSLPVVSERWRAWLPLLPGIV